MMNKGFISGCLLVLLSCAVMAQEQKGKSILLKMHKRYQKAPCQSYTFSQKNKHYRNDTVVRQTEWHEAVEFPDKFTIVFGDSANGNRVVFRNDSALHFRKNGLMKAVPDSNNLLLMLGGMYYRKFDDVAARLNKAGYDLSGLSEEIWGGREVYVIGSSDSLSNRIWVDKKDLRIVRIVERMNDKEMMDLRFEAFQPWCRGYVETKVSFRRNGKLEQEEEYFDLKKR
jgi:hypothetical protein